MSALGLIVLTLALPDPDYSRLSNSQYSEVNANLSFQAKFGGKKLRTLSTTNAASGSDISGLLYVPQLPQDSACHVTSFVSENATHRANLPHTDYTLIALAPWINPTCTLAYLAAVQSDPIRAFLFYLTDNGAVTPPLPNSNVWGLGDGGQWKTNNKFPVYAMPGADGNALTEQLALYSGNVTEVPYGHELANVYHPSDYIRLAADIGVGGHNSLPSLWVFLLVVLAIFIFIIGFTSCLMHWIQRKRRQRLRRQVASGEVDLEALGIKRLTVPQEMLINMPLYVYTDDGESSLPSSGPPRIDAGIPPATLSIMPEQTAKETSMPAIPHHDSDTISLTPTSHPSSSPRHHATPFSQPTCAICLDDFEPNETTVRQLPCQHIFHPDCVDSFLINNSSLCPLCKKSVLPKGYCPATVTNAMVHRERMVRRIRERVSVRDGDNGGNSTQQDGGARSRQFAGLPMPRVRRAWRDAVAAASRCISCDPTPASPNIEMQRVDVPATAAAAPPAETTASAAPPQGQAAGRREWARQRALAMLESRRDAQEERLEAIGRRRPGWRKVIGRVWPGLT